MTHASESFDVLIAGQSHVVALGIPLKPSQPDFDIIEIQNVGGRFGGATGPWKGMWKDDYWDFLARSASGKDVVLVWGGNQHNSHFLLETNPPVDFFYQACPAMREDDAEIIPKAMLEAFFASSLRHLPTVIGKLRAGGAKRVFLLGTPPPKQHLERLLSVVASSDFWKTRAQEYGVDPQHPKTTPPLLRLKLWMLIQELTARAAQSVGAEYLALPASVFDAEGYLKEEYWAEDLTHANPAYGEKVLAHLAETL